MDIFESPCEIACARRLDGSNTYWSQATCLQPHSVQFHLYIQSKCSEGISKEMPQFFQGYVHWKRPKKDIESCPVWIASQVHFHFHQDRTGPGVAYRHRRPGIAVSAAKLRMILIRARYALLGRGYCNCPCRSCRWNRL